MTTTTGTLAGESSDPTRHAQSRVCPLNLIPSIQNRMVLLPTRPDRHICRNSRFLSLMVKILDYGVIDVICISRFSPLAQT